VQKETKGQKLRRMTSKQLKIWLLKAWEPIFGFTDTNGNDWRILSTLVEWKLHKDAKIMMNLNLSVWNDKNVFKFRLRLSGKSRNLRQFFSLSQENILNRNKHLPKVN
jgi:hypothetical protein